MKSPRSKPRIPFLVAALLLMVALVLVVQPGIVADYPRFGIPLTMFFGFLLLFLYLPRYRINSREAAGELSELKRMEQSLKEDVQRLERALEGANDATWEWDVIADRGFVDSRYYEMTENIPGEAEINFAFFLGNVHPDDVASVKTQLTDHLSGATGRYSAQYRLVTRSGKLRYVMGRGRVVTFDAAGRPALMSGMVTDVTDMKRLNDEVNRIKSLESIGLLAGGLAHDFNNVMNIIYGNVSFAKMLVGSDPVIAGSLADAEEACERAKDLGIRLQAMAQGTSPGETSPSTSAGISPATEGLLDQPSRVH